MLLVLWSLTGFSQSYDWRKFEFTDNHFDFNDTMICGNADSFGFEGIGLSSHCEMVLQRTDSISPTSNVARYYQFHKGIKVSNSDLIVTEENGIITYMHGYWASDLDVDTSNLLSDSAAVDTLTLVIDTSSFYAWQDTSFENEIKRELDDSLASNYPVPVEEIYYDGEEYIVAYKIRLYCLIPDTTELVYYIDATSGEFLESYSPYLEEGVTGTVTPKYVSCTNSEDFHTFKKNSSKFYLKDDESRIHTRDDGWNYWTWRGEVTDSDNDWGCTNVEAAAHWGAQQAHEFFHQTFGPDGFKNGRFLRIVTQSNRSTYTDIDLNKDYIRANLSPANNGNWRVDLDIVGHEYVHAFNADYANFRTHSGESGYLGESFADIFGCLIEDFATGSLNWGMGTGSYLGVGNRNLETGQTSAAGQGVQARIYKGIQWDVKDEIHLRGGVQNKWFQLLVDGGTFNGVTVNSIGKTKAGKITYNNMTSLSKTSSYKDAAHNSLKRAQLLFGKCSPEWQSTLRAWYAVGVTEDLPPIDHCLFMQFPDGPKAVAFTIGHIDSMTSIELLPVGYLDDIDTAITYTYDAPSSWQFHLSGDTFTLTHITSPVVTDTLWITAERGAVNHTFFQVLQVYDDSSESAVCVNNLLNKSTNKVYSSTPFDVSIFPNPTSDYIRLYPSNPTIGISEITIFNLAGKAIVSTTDLGQIHGKINISDIDPGMYIVQVKTNHKDIFKRILVH